MYKFPEIPEKAIQQCRNGMIRAFRIFHCYKVVCAVLYIKNKVPQPVKVKW